MAKVKKKTLKEKLNDYLQDSEESVMLYDNYEDAFVGLGYQQYKGPIAIYDAKKCVEILIEEYMLDPDCESREMAEQMAVEYFEYNSVGAWYGEGTPIFMSSTKEDL
jgi:ribosomal protein S24E|tara:strand:- start:349 stop:669 length:321 start_codon:yes stop_codon:yes gene_type:complete